MGSANAAKSQRRLVGNVLEISGTAAVFLRACQGTTVRTGNGTDGSRVR